MPIPQRFRKQSSLIPSYDFIELASGRGIIEFYPADTMDGSTTLYTLSDFSFYSAVGFTSGDADTTIDIDFDAVLSRALNMFGTAIISFPLSMSSVSDVSTEHSYTFTVYLRKYSGAAETDIGSETFVINQDIPLNTWVHKFITVKIPITSTVHFKKGDYIRVTLQKSAQGGANPSHRVWYVGFDPAGRAYSASYLTFTSQAKALIPVKVDL